MCEERAQGNGATTVRVMRHGTRARRGGGIPLTKYRAADRGCSAREESCFSPKGETNTCAVSPAPEGATRGHGRGLAERNPFRRGGLHRTRPRSRICIRRVGRRTCKAPASKGEHCCPDRDRTMSSIPAQDERFAPPCPNHHYTSNDEAIFRKAAARGTGWRARS